MEIAHAQRDHMTRDFHNKIDTDLFLKKSNKVI